MQQHVRAVSEMALDSGAPMVEHRRNRSLRDLVKSSLITKASASKLSLEPSKDSGLNPADNGSDAGTPVASPPPDAVDSQPTLTRGASAAQRMFDEATNALSPSGSDSLTLSPGFSADAENSASNAVAESHLLEGGEAAGLDDDAAPPREHRREQSLKDAVVAMFAARPPSHVEVPLVASSDAPSSAHGSGKASPTAGKPHRRTLSFMERMAALFDTSAAAGEVVDPSSLPAPTPATTPANAVENVEHSRNFSLSKAFKDYFTPETVQEGDEPAAYSPDGQYLPPAFRDGRRGSEHGANVAAAAAASVSFASPIAVSAPSPMPSPSKDSKERRVEESAVNDDDDAASASNGVADGVCGSWLVRLFSRK